jgi:hypothetical protein
VLCGPERLFASPGGSSGLEHPTAPTRTITAGVCPPQHLGGGSDEASDEEETKEHDFTRDEDGQTGGGLEDSRDPSHSSSQHSADTSATASHYTRQTCSPQFRPCQDAWAPFCHNCELLLSAQAKSEISQVYLSWTQQEDQRGREYRSLTSNAGITKPSWTQLGLRPSNNSKLLLIRTISCVTANALTQNIPTTHQRQPSVHCSSLSHLWSCTENKPTAHRTHRMHSTGTDTTCRNRVAPTPLVAIHGEKISTSRVVNHGHNAPGHPYPHNSGC